MRLPEFKNEEVALRKRNDLLSDDVHVIALAMWTGARIHYAADKNLIRDIMNPQIIHQPRGKVHSGKRNSSLPTRNVCKT